MNRKIFIVLVSFLMAAGLAYAAGDYTSENVEIRGSGMGGTGNVPFVEIIKVSLGSDDTCSIGDAVVWDVTRSDGAGLGYCVRRCDVNSASSDRDSDMGQYTQFAGVMVTTTSKDSSQLKDDYRAYGPETGYMAIRGFCDAKMFYTATSGLPNAVKGQRLVMTGNNLVASLGTAASSIQAISDDIGVLLEGTTTTGGSLVKVWLR